MPFRHLDLSRHIETIILHPSPPDHSFRTASPHMVIITIYPLLISAHIDGAFVFFHPRRTVLTGRAAPHKNLLECIFCVLVGCT